MLEPAASLCTADGRRLRSDIARQLVEAEWPRHEAARHAMASTVPASPPAWRSELLSYPDMGPSDPACAKANRNRPPLAMDWDAEDELLRCNAALAAGTAAAAGRSEGDPPAVADGVPDAVAELVRRGETRTPLLLPWGGVGLPSEAAALAGVSAAAAGAGATATTVVLSGAENADGAMAVLERCLGAGAWFVAVQRGPPDHALYRRMAVRLMTVVPDPAAHPGREHFRLWVVMDDAVDLSQPVYPPIFTHNALMVSAGSHTRHKVVRKLCADPAMRQSQLQRRASRAGEGRSDVDAEPEPASAAGRSAADRLTGLWFVRSQEIAAANDAAVLRNRIDLPSKVVFRRRHVTALAAARQSP
eukprot:TRINITY_DN3081_c1_g2_i1.p1 TRINITY_DN3081_c1_g2~~TRINITY_DN3081_c1_g2_i1.p1  ORF type:complete len:360 (+),score=139.91 TRINITY_DN3081_c1_g2_i1:48-1127(+)